MFSCAISPSATIAGTRGHDAIGAWAPMLPKRFRSTLIMKPHRSRLKITLQTRLVAFPDTTLPSTFPRNALAGAKNDVLV
jgi:hypothetical protein